MVKRDITQRRDNECDQGAQKSQIATPVIFWNRSSCYSPRQLNTRRPQQP